MKKFMETHKGCPYYDKDAGKCVREGCLFIYPCKASEEYKRTLPYSRKFSNKKTQPKK